MTRDSLRNTIFACLAALLAACGGAAGPAAGRETATAPLAEPAGEEMAEAAPAGQLPDHVTPLSYTLSLEVLPERDSFRGEVAIRVRLSQPTRRIWMHGARMSVSSAAVEVRDEETDETVVVPAIWEPAEREGIAALRLSRALEAGDATIRIAYEAPYDRQLKGLYRVDVGEDHYAFTQFEPTSARYAFPSFDEPRWKTPFDVSLTVRREHVAIANTRELDRVPLEGGLDRVRYATTLPLPTYLIAIAVGPLDVVEAPPIPASTVRARPLPFRGVAARGRGPELAHALDRTPAILSALEAWFGTEYPYDKLDVIAVPDFAAGAMENAGAITFREWLLLLGESPPEDQRRAFANVMAHELAHQWFGNLVTMPWWDDIWLNEAFATWMASKIVARTDPEMSAELAQLASVHGAMGQDALSSARRIRQPIESDHDIRNAFDAITYSKGGGVLSMFESWVGPDVFREGIRIYLRQHRFRTATSEDLLGALSEAAGRDVATPFRTFLEQPGVPLLEARLECSASGGERGAPVIHLAQSLYTPVGSSTPRARVWSVPVCVTYPVRGRRTATTCDLLTEASGQLALEEAEACPAWVMPNAGAAGYYRWSLPPEQLRALLERGWAHLSAAERVSVANNLRAAFASASVPGGEIVAMMPRLAQDPTRLVATEAMGLADHVVTQIVSGDREIAARAWAGGLFRARAQRLGWTPRAGEDGDARLLRRDVLGFMANVARDPRVRAEAARRGRELLTAAREGRPAAAVVAPDLAGLAVSVAMQEGDAALWDEAASLLFASGDALMRTRLLVALSSAEDPVLAERALALALDPRLRVNEVPIPLSVQVERDTGRARAWAWLTENFDALAQRVATTRAGAAPWIFAGFCDREQAQVVRSFFEPLIGTLPGGPRNLAGALEAMELCAARVTAQRESVERTIAR